MVVDVKNLVGNCLLYVLSRSGSKVSRPFGTTLLATKPSEVIHFDYLFLDEGPGGHTYGLVVKHEISGYC